MEEEASCTRHEKLNIDKLCGVHEEIDKYICTYLCVYVCVCVCVCVYSKTNESSSGRIQWINVRDLKNNNSPLISAIQYRSAQSC